MTKHETYMSQLQALAEKEWEPFLLKHSGLPGPRGNLELAQAAADLGRPELFEQWLKLGADQAPTNSPEEFLAFCGVVGLGRLLAEGQLRRLRTLRRCASDPRWRLREGVAMALQRWGDADMGALIAAMQVWSEGSPLEQRAAAAALCEPRLLKDPAQVRQVLEILDTIMTRLPPPAARKTDDFAALKKGLGYCWSVAAAASLARGQAAMEKWLTSPDPDVRWIMKENLTKNRLVRLDRAWVARWQSRLAKASAITKPATRR
jgi:hypothetical protein